MSNEQEKLGDIRADIDAIDEQIQDLISRRARAAQEVARIKRASNPDIADFYRPEREAEILRKIKARNKGPLDDDVIVGLFRQIMSDCLALQLPLVVAYLGPEGTYTHAAARKQFGSAIEAVSLAAIDEVFREVESGAANYGVVPVENSTEGMINHTLDMFLQSPLKICGEVSLRIHHHLVGKADNLGKVKKVYGHAQALAQCREWLDHNLPQVERIAMASNGEAARMASMDAEAVATASETAASIYGLNSLARNIEDNPDNTTRFFIIGKKDVAPSGKDKTTLLLSTPNRPGALHDVLTPLAEHGVSMSRIESRPSRRAAWDYVFFIDIEGHKKDEKVARVLTELEKNQFLLRVLGSYPVAISD